MNIYDRKIESIEITILNRYLSRYLVNLVKTQDAPTLTTKSVIPTATQSGMLAKKEQVLPWVFQGDYAICLPASA